MEEFKSAFALIYSLYVDVPLGYGIIAKDRHIYTSPHIVSKDCIVTIKYNDIVVPFDASKITENGTIIQIPVSNYKDKVCPIKLPLNLLIAINIFHFNAVGHAGHKTHSVTGHRFFSPNFKSK